MLVLSSAKEGIELAASRQSHARETPHRSWRGVSPEERIAERRSRLLDAGRDLITRGGSAAVGVNEVCSASGVTKRYFYESFAGLDEFVDLVFTRAREEVIDRISEAASSDPDGTTNPQAYVTAMVRVFIDNPDLVRLMFEPLVTRDGRTGYGDRLLETGLDLRRALGLPDLSETSYQVMAHAVSGAISLVTRARLNGTLIGEATEIIEELSRLIMRMIEP
jgi:AcrR family transcriptional regulator